jgi:hypothetical protein
MNADACKIWVPTQCRIVTIHDAWIDAYFRSLEESFTTSKNGQSVFNVIDGWEIDFCSFVTTTSAISKLTSRNGEFPTTLLNP